MTSTDAFALKNSELNAFLFADVGTELNGSALTMLSVLARLEKDPWAEAAKWTNLPKRAAIDCLTQSIGKMPLGPRSDAETSAIASRLFLLLPTQARDPSLSTTATVTTPRLPNWIPIAVLGLSFVLGLAFNVPPAPTTAPRADSAATMALSVDQPVAARSE